MFDLADHVRCRHRALVLHFGERIADCATSCSVCLGADVVTDARSTTKPPSVGGRRRDGAGTRGTAAASSTLDEAASALFGELRALRRAIAEASGVPAYVVFSDASLREMAARRPTSREALLAVPGVGPVKIERYGAAFLQVLRGRADAAAAPGS
jgi:ATP-dependent DNA helicase RecQ